MLAAISKTRPVLREVFAEASELVHRDLWQLAQEGPIEELNQTRWTQPLMLTADYAMFRAWEEEGGAPPDFVAGHSLGEYAALVVAGSLDFADALRLVQRRGELMQNAVPEGTGAMAAVLGIAEEDLLALCQREAHGEVLELANLNAPGQIVVAGHRAAVERLSERAKDAGAKKVVLLPVSVPSHCSLMREAAEQFAADLAAVELRSPNILLVHNVDAHSHRDPESIREALRKQIYSPVRWTESIRFLARQGATTFAEMGPGKVLSGLGKRIEPSLRMLALDDEKSFVTALEDL